MLITYDAEANAAYIELNAGDEIQAVRQVSAYVSKDDYEVILDLSKDGYLLGIEIIGARSALLGKILDQAQEP